MRRFNEEVFDEVIKRDIDYYTSSKHDNPLGRFDRLVIQVVVDYVKATEPTGALKVYVENSGDGRSWNDKNGAEVLSMIVDPGVTKTVAATDGATPLALALVRLRIRLSATSQARARVYVTARDIGR